MFHHVILTTPIMSPYRIPTPFVWAGLWTRTAPKKCFHILRPVTKRFLVLVITPTLKIPLLSTMNPATLQQLMLKRVIVMKRTGLWIWVRISLVLQILLLVSLATYECTVSHYSLNCSKVYWRWQRVNMCCLRTYPVQCVQRYLWNPALFTVVTVSANSALLLFGRTIGANLHYTSIVLFAGSHGWTFQESTSSSGRSVKFHTCVILLLNFRKIIENSHEKLVASRTSQFSESDATTIAQFKEAIEREKRSERHQTRQILNPGVWVVLLLAGLLICVLVIISAVSIFYRITCHCMLL